MLSLPKVEANSFRYFAAKQWNSAPNELRLKAGGLEFNKQVTSFVTLDADLTFMYIFLSFFLNINLWKTCKIAIAKRFSHIK